ncbi:MAG: pyridoxine 5'-phosphate synthase [Phycisphaerales bacterium]|nr:pyridoxine 5'-phosphate synthase [Planctomycetota bacterium]MCH8509289.1 pyridoxine 5'-phosphate synthase [Phycisphaerales bacterium]
MIQLGVNIDHVATVRQARYRDFGHDDGEPDPVRAAHEAELGGADGITVHLREDRRHIQDRDVELLHRLVKVKLNLEMAATDEMVRIACEVRPHTAMLVPEGRAEVTTEGGLDVAGQRARLAGVVASLKDAGMIVSAFIDPEAAQVEAAAALGFDVCEVHTGPYARAFAACGGDMRRRELIDALGAVEQAGRRIREMGMRFNAGHALNYHNVRPVAALEGIEELHIGHAIVSRAVYTGMRGAVAEMKRIMVESAG